MPPPFPEQFSSFAHACTCMKVKYKEIVVWTSRSLRHIDDIQDSGFIVFKYESSISYGECLFIEQRRNEMTESREKISGREQ